MYVGDYMSRMYIFIININIYVCVVPHMEDNYYIKIINIYLFFILCVIIYREGYTCNWQLVAVVC